MGALPNIARVRTYMLKWGCYEERSFLREDGNSHKINALQRYNLIKTSGCGAAR